MWIKLNKTNERKQQKKGGKYREDEREQKERGVNRVITT